MRSPRTDHEGVSPQTFTPLSSPHTPNYRQRQPLINRSGSATSPDDDRQDDDRWKKDATTLKQKRQRQCVIITLLTLIVGYLVTQRFLMKTIIHSTPYPSTPIVPNSPHPPSPDSPTVPIFAHPGFREYELPSEAFSADGDLKTSFTVYLPSSLKRSDAHKYWSTLPSSDDAYHSYPLVFSLHGRSANASVECAHWKFYAEAHQWIVVCPTLSTAARAQYTTIDQSVVYLTAVMDSVLGDEHEGVKHASTPSLSLTRLIDRKRILLTGYSGAGYSLTAFALTRPNYWTAFSARSSNFWKQHFQAKLLPATTQLAVEAYERGEWQLPITAQTSPRPSNSHIAELFWTTMFEARPFLFQRGELDHTRVREHLEAMHDTFRNFYGARHVQSEVMQEEKHESRIDNTARWWAKKHVTMKIAGAKP
jgi:hypothetical protein